MSTDANGRAAAGSALNGDLGPDLLRQVIREVLAEALPGLHRPEHRAAPAHPAHLSGPPTSVPAADPAPEGSDVVVGTGVVGGQSAAVGAGMTAGNGVTVGSAAALGVGAVAGPGAVAGLAWTVRVSTDSELHDFVLRVLRLADNPKVRRDLISGKARFRLAAGPGGAAAAPIHRVEKGAVTERVVAAAAQAGARLVLGRRAVLTPLARDSARALGVPIEKEH
jgi:hypothetical protein